MTLHAFLLAGLSALLLAPAPTFATEVLFDQPVVQVVPYGKGHLFITPTRVFSQGLRHPVQFSVPAAATAAAVQNGQIWVATASGLYRFDPALPDKTFPVLFSGQSLSGLALDSSQHLWAGVTYQGAYRQEKGDSFSLKLQIPAISSVVAAAGDTNVWIGTNVGLYRMGIHHFTTTRYAEEGYSGYELPDNIVEKLFQDAAGNVWVQMPEHLSFKKSSRSGGELPTFAFLGDRTNEVRSIQAVGADWYLFCTQKGLSFMPARPLEDDHVHPTTEVYSSEGLEARALTSQQLSVPDRWATQPVTQIFRSGSTYWFVTAAGGWSVPEKKLRKLLQRAGSAKPTV
jgi:lipopolysaccharide export system protein LptC